MGVQFSDSRQAVYINVTLRPLRATIGTVEKQLLLHIVSGCL